jgi:cytochrome c-type biogenesis protein CcmE
VSSRSDEAIPIPRGPGALRILETARKERISMNSRARNRLIGVTAIILILAAVLLVTLLPSGAAYTSLVKEIATNEKLVGTRVKVTGTVVPGSWDKKTNPMVFRIRAEGSSSGPDIDVVYNGSAPNTFGNDTVAILTGTVDKLGSIQANDMLTKCPSKYETKSDAASIGDALAVASDTPIRVAGFLKAGTLADASAATRFVLSANSDGTGPSMYIVYSGAMPDGTKDGVEFVVFGKVETTSFIATDVAIAKK